jgi:predicted NBD/HSP70 family sugar kinase
VSNIVKELTASGLLHTSITSRSGRRATLVSLTRQLGLVAGVHFSARQLHIAIADATRTVVTQRTLPLPLDHRHDAELDRLSILLSDMMETLGGTVGELLAVGLALPAPIDPRTGMVSTPGLLRGWEGIDVAESLTARIGRPVFVDSEANLAGLAEAREGSARSASSSVFIRVGHTISAGLIVGGDLFRGVNGKAGQIGHVTIDENGPICRCGNRGCLDTFVGSRALINSLAASHGPLRLKDIVARALAGDLGCRRVIEDAGRRVGVAVAGVVNLLNPEAIAVGGLMAEAGDLILGPLREALDRCAIPSAAATVELRPAELGDQADIVGAIHRASMLSHSNISIS